MKIKKTLRSNFVITFSLFIILVTVMLSYIIGKKSTEQVKNYIGKSLADISFQTVDKLDQFMWSRYGELTVLSELDVFKEKKDNSSISDVLNELKAKFPSYAWIGFISPEGYVISSTDNILKGVDISQRPVYSEALKAPFIGDVHDAVLLSKLLPNPTGEAMKFVDISTPIYDDSNKLVGILASHLSWQWIKEVQETMKPQLSQYNKAETFIVSGKDNSIILGPQNMLGSKLNLNSIKKDSIGNINGWSVETWPDGKRYLTGYAQEKGYRDYKGLGWTVIVRQPLNVAYTPADELKSHIIIFGLIFAAIFAVLGYILAGMIANPLTGISESAEKLRLGEKVEIPKYEGIKEIESLSLSLRSLLKSLTSTENALEKMEQLANYDSLTNLPNRTALASYQKQLLERANSDNCTLTFLYLDLDGFKPVNDTYGHHMGDLILRDVAIRLKSILRMGEVAVRLGGDEFLLILFTPRDNANETGKFIADRLIKEIRKPFIINDISINVGCSIGGAVYPNDEVDSEKLISFADKALYYSKNHGKNCITFHEDITKNS